MNDVKKLWAVQAGYFKLDGGAMFGVVPKSMWEKLNPADANNMCTWSTRCLLVETADRLVLVDNGIGAKQGDKFLKHYFLHGEDSLDKSLSEAGFLPSDITDAFLTHLHFDHCGGSVVRVGDSLETAFKNAQYWSNSKHWAWAVSPNAREKASFLTENILPIQESGQLRWIEEGKPLGGVFDILTVDGHTEKQMLPMVPYKGKTLVFCGDLIPSMYHIPLPYVMAYDLRPLETLKEKEALLETAADKGYVLMFEHDPINECCTVKRTDKGIRPDQVFRLSDW